MTDIVSTVFTDAPVDFSSGDIDNPEIVYLEQEQQVPVTLFCKFKILRGIEKWKNVTYKIEWFVDGNLAKKPTIICKPGPGLNENQTPCPGRTPFMAELIGKGNNGIGDYRAGQTVSPMKTVRSILEKLWISVNTCCLINQSFYCSAPITFYKFKYSNCHR